MHLAATEMDFVDIKLLSRSGAVTKERGGWKWYDPGNFVYAMLWHMIRIVAEVYLKKYRGAECPRDARVAHSCRNFLFAMCLVRCRWPREVDSKRGMERLGDMFEM